MKIHENRSKHRSNRRLRRTSRRAECNWHGLDAYEYQRSLLVSTTTTITILYMKFCLKTPKLTTTMRACIPAGLAAARGLAPPERALLVLDDGATAARDRTSRRSARASGSLRRSPAAQAIIYELQRREFPFAPPWARLAQGRARGLDAGLAGLLVIGRFVPVFAP